MPQGSILALWSKGEAQAPPKGFHESVRLIRQEEGGLKNTGEWRGLVNILSWKHLEQVLGKDYRFEFRHCGKNVCVTTADLSALREGDFIQAGSALLVTRQNGVQCPNRCHLEPGDMAPCVLAENWVIAEVVKSGSIRVDDPILAAQI